MLIGELSRRTGVSPRSLRYYEQQGLLHAGRTASGWRTYDARAAERARTVSDLMSRGLTVAEIRSFAPCLDTGDPDGQDAACADPDLMTRAYRSRLAVLDARLTDLQRRRDDLARGLADLENADAPARRQAGRTAAGRR